MPTVQTAMNRKASKSETSVAVNDTITPKDDIVNGVKPGNFEDAIKATGFGKFNIILLCIIFPGSFAQIVEQTSLGFVVPIAQCDLNLSLEDKGILVSISYTGMILSSFLWGYICDTYGRRRVVIYGYLLESVCYLIAAFSQSFTMLLITKFASGFIFTGPFSALTSYVSEFHSTANRSRVQLMRGVASGMGAILLPMMAWSILPNLFEITLSENIKLHAWNIFVAVCCIPALMTAIVFIFMPESPKFLMSSGKSTEALSIFKRVYRANTGRRFSTYPIKSLVEEKPQDPGLDVDAKVSFTKTLVNGFVSLKPLFKRPYSMRLAHVCINSMIISAGAFAVKLWYPQIFQAINDFEQEQEGENVNICNIVNSLAYQNTSVDATCTVNVDNSSVYINASTQGAIQLVAFMLAGIVVGKSGKKPLILTLAIICTCCPILIYFISNKTVMVVLFPLIVAISEVCGNILMTITMELFPTTFRLTALNLHLMFTRTGIATGNVVLPYLLKAGCLPSLLFISISVLVGVALTSLLPNTDNKALE